MSAEATVEPLEKGHKSKKRSLAKLILLVLNVMLFLSGAGFFALTQFGLMNKPAVTESADAPTTAAHDEHASPPAKDKNHTKDKGHAGKAAKKDQPAGELLTIALQPFVVNLSGDQVRRYLRLVLHLEVEGEDAKVEIESSMAQLRDRLIFLLSSKTVEEINTVQGKYQLQGEITKVINDLLHNPVVERVYFSDFIMQ